MYKVVILTYYYTPDIQGKMQPRIKPELYDTKQEAIESIDELIGDVYLLDHNEYAAPDYLVVKQVDADWIDTGRNHDMSNYDWDDAECECGECGVCISMLIDQDREYLVRAAVYTMR